jgi:predicted nucleic acid-binding protein
LGTVIFVDSNVIIDILYRDPSWVQWSMAQVLSLSDAHDLAINEVVVAEVAPSTGSISTFRAEMQKISVSHQTLTEEAAFCAGEAFQRYRRERREDKEVRRSIIADFLIGGHAHVLQAGVLTRDPRFYRSYFPAVPLITPDKADA